MGRTMQRPVGRRRLIAGAVVSATVIALLVVTPVAPATAGDADRRPSAIGLVPAGGNLPYEEGPPPCGIPGYPVCDLPTGCNADLDLRRDGGTSGRQGTVVFWGWISCLFPTNSPGAYVVAQSRLSPGVAGADSVTPVYGNHINGYVGPAEARSQGSAPVARLATTHGEIAFDLELSAPPGYIWVQNASTTPSGATVTCSAPGLSAITCSIHSDNRLLRPLWYVALGDSYSAGTGTPASQSQTCHQTSAAYPALYARFLDGLLLGNLEFAFLACHGATTQTMSADQLTQVAAHSLGGFPDFITVTIGGNNLIGRTTDGTPAGFAGILQDCILRPVSDCNPSIDTAAASTTLDAAYQSIRQRSGANTTVRVLLYPQVLPRPEQVTTTCPLGISAVEAARLRAMWSRANEIISNRVGGASTAGVRFLVEPTGNVLAGHEICSADPWAVGLGVSSVWNETAFHPNHGGHNAMFQTLTR